MKHTCRCTCTAYGGACDCRFDGKTQGAADERRKIVTWLRANRERWIDEAAGDDRTTADYATDAIERGDHDEETTP